MNDKSKFICLIIFGLFLTALISRNVDLILMDILFIVYLGAGIGQSPAREEIRLNVQRIVMKFKRDNAFSVDVVVQVCNEGGKNTCFFLADPLQKGMNITDGSLNLRTALGPGEKTELHYVFEAGRGSFCWVNSRMTVSDPFGLIETEIDVDAGSEVFVQPRLKKFRPIPLRLWKTLSSPGSIPIRMGGSGTDFWGVRDYHPGDPLKLLDWRLTARHPHKYFTREFVQEKTAEITLVLDGRPQMELVVGKESLFEREVNAAASLAEMFLRQGNRVSLYFIGKSRLRVLPDYGKIQLHRILNCLARAEIKTDGVRGPLYHLPFDLISPKSMIIVISPVDSNDINFYRLLRAFGFEVMLISPDTFDFSKPLLEKDNKTTHWALRASRLERNLDLRLISQLSVSVIDWRVGEALPPLIRKTLGRPLKVRKM